MRTIKLLITLFLLGLSYNSFAQCPYGIPPPCVPADAPGWGGGASGGGNTPSKPQGKIFYTWGAISQDSAFVGASNSSDTKDGAKAKAIEKCLEKSTGDKNCQVIFTFYNQCAAYAESKDHWAVNSEATIEKAQQKALKACQKKTTSPDAECKVLIASCTKTFLMHPDGRMVDY